MNHTYTCIIIDDEEYAIGMLRESLHSLYNNINITGTYTSWKDGLKALRTLKADIVFLDVSLGEKTGMDVLTLAPELNCEIIFVTAHSEYALDAFRFSATGYIVKPVREVDLMHAVDKAIERINNKQLSTAGAPKTVSHSPKIGIPGNKGIDYVDVNSILYLEAISGYTKVITSNSQILSSFRLGKFKKVLEGHPFYQVHRSYIVNLDHVRRYNMNGAVIMSDNREIPVSKDQREAFLHLFDRVTKGEDE